MIMMQNRSICCARCFARRPCPGLPDPCRGCENAGQVRSVAGRWRAVWACNRILTGSAGAGAAIGAVTGAGVARSSGDQNRRNKEAMINTYPPPPVYVTGGPLWNLVGDWTAEGDSLTPDGQHIFQRHG